MTRIGQGTYEKIQIKSFLTYIDYSCITLVVSKINVTSSRILLIEI
jgi:hypothetical protein